MEETLFWRQQFRDVSFARTVAAADTTIASIIPAKVGQTLFIQRIIVWVGTDAAQSATFQDTNGTPVVIAKIAASPGANVRFDFDFGGLGYPCTADKGFSIVLSAAGLGFNVRVYAYARPTVTL